MYACGFRICFTPLPGFFSPFPHGTGSLSVDYEYLALEDGPPIFRQDFTCPALLLASSVPPPTFRIRGCHPLRPPFPERSAKSIAKACRLLRVRFAHLCIQCAMTLAGRVSPFGHLRIKARLPAPRSLSQATASFIACNRQGIHHVHLVACPYNVDLWSTHTPKTLSERAVCPTVDACLIRYNHNPSAHPHPNCE